MERYFILDKYNTWYDWDLVLTAKTITPPELKTNYVDIDGVSGTIDLSESLTGEITYKDRTISASFWTNKGNRRDRERLLRDITIALHGKKIKVIEPDDPTHYFIGRVAIKSLKNILPYAEFTIDIICEPWRYAIEDTVRTVSISSSTSVDVVVCNNGAKTVCPTIKVSGTVTITYGGVSLHNLTEGTYKSPDIKLKHGVNLLNVSGEGAVVITYKEADL